MAEYNYVLDKNEIISLVNKIEYLEQENKRLKQGIKHYQRGMFKIISIANECKNSKEWNYKEK